MQILKLRLDQIQVPPTRQRVEVDGDALAQLMDSIATYGLLHPVVVRATSARLDPASAWPEPTGDPSQRVYILVAGGRRLAAITNLAGMGQTYLCSGVRIEAGFCAAVNLGDLDQLSAEEAELEENIRRVDLTWAERAAATAHLARLRNQRAIARGVPLPSTAELAAEVRGGTEGPDRENTRRELILAPLLERNVEYLKGAKSLDEAWKAHTRAEEAERHAALGQSVGATFGAHSHTLIKGNCIEWIRNEGEARYDVILTDPPYGMGADDFGDAGGRLKSQVHNYDDSAQGWQDLIGTLGSHWYRVAKPQAHLYLCCDIDGFHFAREWLERVGWRVHRTPLVNYKLDGSRVPWPQHGPQRKWELVLYAVKGNKPVTRIYSDVIETRGDENYGHGAQKPVALYKNLLVRSVHPGDTVLDCFGGTGTILPACHELKCKATYVEQDEVCYGIALKRLGELK